jgi:Fur family peroxide stress response transcriptional regulator
MITKKERLYKIIKQAHINVTPQRIEVLSFFEDTKFHPTALDVWKHLKEIFPSISKTTVYNILDTFVKLKILNVIHTDNTSKYDFNLTPHAHFVCIKCGKIQDIEFNDLFLKKPVLNHKINEIEIYLRGICENCSKKRE